MPQVGLKSKWVTEVILQVATAALYIHEQGKAFPRQNNREKNKLVQKENKGPLGHRNNGSKRSVAGALLRSECSATDTPM